MLRSAAPAFFAFRPAAGVVRDTVADVRALTVLLVLAACVACTAAPAPTPPDAGPTTTAAPGAITLPPRPRDVPIDDVDPCSLLTEAQRADLDLTGSWRPYISSTQLMGEADSCGLLNFNSSNNVALGMILADEKGIERFTSGELLTDVSPLTVEGFPAVLAVPRDFPEVCNVVVDIAPGQLINVDLSDGGGDRPEIPQDDLCDGAQRIATEVMRTLLASA